MNASVDDALLSEPMRQAMAIVAAVPQGPETALARRVIVSSRYVSGLIVRKPDLFARVHASGALSPGAAPLSGDAAVARYGAEIEDAIEAGATAEQALRHVRQSVYLTILWRMSSGMAPLEETLAALSDFAQAAVRVACREARAALARRFGVPRDADGSEIPLIVIAMGKLGGHELNVSSDIDLIPLYPQACRTDGPRSLEASDWFAREARAVGGLLERVTADGFVFRVDTRLRPFGASGPPVASLASLAGYLRDHARDWERHAMVKARALTGRPQDIAAFEALRCPFVFRRYLDFNALPSLRSLQQLIGERERTRGGDDVKLGRGGIRELEFLVQAFQLVRGGRVPALQQRGLLQTLATLGEIGLLPAKHVQALDAAYRYLRRVENGLQALDDAQTHRLPPAGHEDLQRVAIGLGEPSAAAMLERLAAHRAEVVRCFDAVFAGEGIGGQAQAPAASEPAPSEPVDRADAQHDDIDALLAAVCAEPSITRLGESARARVAALVDALRAPLHGALPDAAMRVPTAQRVLGFVRAAAGRGGYLQVLLERAGALHRLVQVFARSAWVAQALTRQPVLVDELLRPGMDEPALSAEACRQELAALVATLEPGDLEAQMNALRHFRQVEELRIALAWLDESLSVMQVSDRLSWLAEALLHESLTLVRAELTARHGRPCCLRDGESSASPVALAVIAYGKLGGLELGHGSDLDLVFLHDSAGSEQRSDGPEPLENGLWFARLVRRFTHFMSVRTEAGLLYEIDLRLRPNGTAGLLVTSVDAFEGYQRDDAWTWEHQALLRARGVLGDAALLSRFEAIRVDILCHPRAASELAVSVSDMRERMRAVHGTAPAGRMHLKRDPGGITDLEFVVQYLALAHAAAHPTIVRYSDNVRVLDAAHEAGVIDAALRDEAQAVWLGLRARLQTAALSLEGADVPRDAELDRLAARCIALRDRFLGAPDSPSQAPP